jgi:hypothetical protein
MPVFRYEHRMARPSLLLSAAWAALVAALILLAGRPPDRSSTLPPSARPDPPLVAGPAEALHPVPAQPVRPLPRLADSDGAIRAGIARIPGGEALRPYTEEAGIIRRAVLAVDGVAHDAGEDGKSREFALGLEHAPGIGALDARGAVALYRRFYPLFQEAYAERRGSGGYFNDALVRAIDRVLCGPGLERPDSPAWLIEVRGLLALRGPQTSPGRSEGLGE